MSFFHRSGIVNVKMVITEEKILSNIDKIQKLINPNSKKQIVQLQDDSYFKDLVESIKTYLLEYPKKKNFPRSVYKASYDLVEYATNQFEENTRRIELLIRKREKNIKLGSVLRDATAAVKAHAKNWKEIVKKLSTKYPADVAESLNIIGSSVDTTTEEYQDACKLIEAKVKNLEQNLHIEIDMERIEDRSKALSYIGIEIAEALKYIPAPADDFVSGANIFEEPMQEAEEQVQEVAPVQETVQAPVAPVAPAAAEVQEPVQAVNPVVFPVSEPVQEPVQVAAPVQEPVASSVQVNPAFADLFSQAEELVTPVTTPAYKVQAATPIPDEVTTVDNMTKMLEDALDDDTSVVEAPTLNNVHVDDNSTVSDTIESSIKEHDDLVVSPMENVESVSLVDAMIKDAGLENDSAINYSLAAEEQKAAQAEQLKEQQAFIEETRFEAKPTLWQRIKNSKIVRTFKYIMSIRIKLDYPALPEGRGE